MKFEEIELLIDAFSSLPSISRKAAEKISYFLIEQDDAYIHQLIRRISNLKDNVSLCNVCNNLCQGSNYCQYCTNSKLNRNNLAIVTNFNDVTKIEESEEHDGLYFVLLSEINYKRKDTSRIDMQYLKIKKMIEDNNINNILLATSVTYDGELTANYLDNLIKRDFKDISVYRLATGMPFNSSIDYIDIDSLKQSIKNKIKM